MTLAWILAGCVAAFFLHESTHYVTARLLGRQARIAWRDAAVHFAWDGHPGWQELVIFGAPVAVGTVAGGVWLAVADPTVREAIILAPAWWLYTFHGAVVGDDFDFVEAEAQGL